MENELKIKRLPTDIVMDEFNSTIEEVIFSDVVTASEVFKISKDKKDYMDNLKKLTEKKIKVYKNDALGNLFARLTGCMATEEYVTLWTKHFSKDEIRKFLKAASNSYYEFCGQRAFADELLDIKLAYRYLGDD